jgi:glycosyltransferase involved in cell wall biosynthesis
MKNKFIIVTTIPISLGFFKGQIKVLKTSFEISLISSPGILLDDICEKEKVFGYPVAIKREISIFKDFISLFKLIKLFYSIKPKVVHGSTPKAGLLSMIAAWVNNVPTRIYYVHGLRYQGAKGFKRRILILMEKLSCFFSSHVYAVGFGVKDLLGKDGITKKNIEVIGNGSVNGINVNLFSSVNSDILDIKEAYGLVSSNFVFGFVGRLVKDKGIQELVLTFLKINKLNPETRLLLVGDYENEDPIGLEIKKEIVNNSNIINVGYQKDVRSFLKLMDVFVFPSYREGFGVSVMEAGAMEIPVISSNIIGCNEIIQNGVNGILIKPKSKEDLYRAMGIMLKDLNVLNGMGEKSRKLIIEKFEQKKLWENTLKSYTNII